MGEVELCLAFFIISLMYSSVGFGGGSSYLALLTFYGMEYHQLRILALLCNIVVVTTGVFHYYKAGYLNWKKTLPIILMSVPLAFVAGRMNLGEQLFYLIAGLLLILSAFFLFFTKPVVDQLEIRKGQYWINASIGGGIGFLSGLIGIGGGIFLAPVLHHSKWDRTKNIAATTSLFILVNSIAGIVGQISVAHHFISFEAMIWPVLSVMIGGFIGSRLGSTLLRDDIIKKVTAVLVFYVGIRLLVKYLV